MKKKFSIIAAVLLLVPMVLGAQALKGSYFLDHSLNRNKLNPAFSPDTKYFQIPVIGNLGVGMYSNSELQDFFYPVNNRLYTYLNKKVTFAEFASSLARQPYLDMAVDLNLINFAVKGAGGFWTVDVGLRTNIDADIPRDLFLFMKKGTGEAGTYNIGSVKLNVDAALQASVGYSRNLSDLVPGLSVGARARVILPAAYVGLDLNKVRLTTSPDKWTITTDARMNAALKGFALTDSDGALSPSMNGTPGPAGFGMSFDLGAEYRLELDGFFNAIVFSASFTDVGFVKYGKKAFQSLESKGEMDWTGMVISLEDGAMDEAMSGLKDEFSKLTSFERVGEEAGFSRSTLPNYYLGLELPFCNDNMSLGVLYSARKSYHHTRNELTVSYNLTPTDWFALGVNYSFLNVAKTIGWILEFTPKRGPNFFIGSDYSFLEFARLPYNSGLAPTAFRFDTRFGIAVALGEGRKRY